MSKLLTVEQLKRLLTIPVIGAPLFIVSGPDLVIEQCKAGIVGSFPALNARQSSVFEEWLQRITSELTAFQKANPNKKVAPFAVNQIVHHTNQRLEEDVALCVKYKVPIIITSLNSPKAVVKSVHSYGGLVFHDVINVKHAKNALDAGVDGLILVATGAGGHAGTYNPFALVSEVRNFYKGTIILSGAISTGSSILGAIAMGADFAYMGTRFIATKESQAVPDYKNMLVDSTMKDIIYTPYFSGVAGNYLIPSIVRAGLNPANLPDGDKSKMNFTSATEGTSAKAWKDIWGAGQGTGTIDDVPHVSELVERLIKEYNEAKQRLAKL